jgi:putative two-component system response regulator
MTSQQSRAGPVLVVDDDPQVRRLFQRILSGAGYATLAAESASEAEAILAERDIPLMLVDVGLGGESGIELVRRAGKTNPDTAALVVTGYDDPAVAEAALEFGAYAYMTKPIKEADLVIATMNALRRRELERLQRDEHERLERAVAARTSELQCALERLEAASAELAKSREQALRRLARAVEFRDVATHGHVERMSLYAGRLAERVGIDADTMRMAAALHDVGKIGIPDSILLKPGPLTPEERLQMQDHTLIGHELLNDPGSRLLSLAAEIALTHHERFDGFGYPRRMRGRDIPISGRIAAIADVYEALTTPRVYRDAYSHEEALEMMRPDSGQFEPDLVREFVDMITDGMAPDYTPAPQ